jgi:hypothetical protein
MRTLALALTLLAAGTSVSLAQCPSVPDDATTGYTANQTALALCRQGEMSDQLRRDQQRMELQGQLNHLELQIRLNDQFSRAQQTIPTPQF